FARLTEGLSLDEDPLTVEDVLDAPTADEEEGEPTIAVVATSVASAKALAGAIRVGREARTDEIDIRNGTSTHDTPSGALAVGPLREAAAHDLAAIASTALQRSGIVLFWRRGDRMTATRYRNGERARTSRRRSCSVRSTTWSSSCCWAPRPSSSWGRVSTPPASHAARRCDGSPSGRSASEWSGRRRAVRGHPRPRLGQCPLRGACARGRRRPGGADRGP